jgi:hypothetical protein
MPDNGNTDAEISYLDDEDWQIAFEPYEGKPRATLTLGFHLAELKRLVDGLKKFEAVSALDRAIDCLFEHSDFRSAGRELFLTAIAGQLTTDQEEVLRHLGIKI